MHTSEQLWGLTAQIIIVLRDSYNPRTKKQVSHLTRTDSEVVKKSPGGGGEGPDDQGKVSDLPQGQFLDWP